MTDWMKTIDKMDGVVTHDYDFYAPENVIKSTSPSLNYIFGRGCGLPFGLSGIAFGPPKAGKSLIAQLLVAGLHAQFPNAIAIKFNTELREGSQSSKEDLLKWKIDPNRYRGFDVNQPEMIFDQLTNDFVPLLENGMPLKLLIIDSMEGIQGIKGSNKESILDHVIGDHALTIGEGLMRILPIIRKYKIAVLCTSHIRANIGAIGMHSPKTKMAGGYAQKHWFEYYIEVKRDRSADSKSSVTGEKFEGETKDFKGNKDITGHKIWTKMTESSTGVAGRTGRFTINYNKGIINVHEEIFELAKNLNIAERPNNTTYIYDGHSYRGKKAFAEAIRDNEELYNKILKEIYARDVA